MEYIQLVKDRKVSKVALFFIEGELMNVVVKDETQFRVGDAIICVIDKHAFSTKIIKKQENNLYVYVPWNELQKLDERRRAVRVDFQTDAQITATSQTVQATIRDVSIKGVGFICKDALLLNQQYPILFTIEDKQHRFDVVIKNGQPVADGFRYGSAFVTATEKELFYVRRYILKEQLGKL